MRNEYLKEVGATIQKVRKEKGISVRELGELIEMDYSGLSRIETGQSNCRLLTLKKIADVLNVSIKVLL